MAEEQEAVNEARPGGTGDVPSESTPGDAKGPADPVVTDPVATAAAESRRKKLVGLGVAFALLAAIVVVVLVAQGGDDGGDTDLDSKPVVEVPEGPPPEELETEDIVEGDGAEATPGSQVTVQYVGVTYEDGKEFDSSWDRGQPFPFQLGAGQVIPGWDQGVAGMRVGGRRKLIIPPDLAYGKQGQPPKIGPNETLVFVVDLLDVQPAGAGGIPGGTAPPTG